MKRLFVFALSLAALFVCAVSFADPPVVSDDEVLSDDVVQGEAIVMIKIDWDGKTEITAEAAYRAADAVADAVGAHVKKINMATTRILGSVSAVISDPDMSAAELIRRLRTVPAVLNVEPNMIYRIDATRPNDPYVGSAKNNLWGMEAIGAPDAWDRITGSNSIYTAVIDTGLYPHDDIDANIDWSMARDFTKTSPAVGKAGMTDPHGHGTHVMGTVAGVGNNNKGVTGVVWNIKAIPLKAGEADGSLNSDAINESLSYLVEQVSNYNKRIASVNMSIGGYAAVLPEAYLRASEEGQILDRLSKTPLSPLVSLSAGNEGLEHGVLSTKVQIKNKDWDDLSKRQTVKQGTMHYSSSLSQVLDNVVSVAAIGPDEGSGYTAAEFSNWSNKYVDIAAPGSHIVSLYNNGGYVWMGGTSMAAPHVAGAAALLAAHMDQLGMTWTGKQLKDMLLANTDKDVNPENLWAKNTGVGTLGNSPTTVGDYRLSKNGLLRIDKAIAYVDSIATVKTITLTLGASSIDKETSTTVTAAVTPSALLDSRKTITWTASPSDAVDITSTGATTATITGKKTGTVTITATAIGGVSNTITLTVNAATHAHSWSWTNDETNHWQACDCGAKQNIAPHTATTWNKNSTTHSKTCTETSCGRTFAEGSHAAASGASWQKNSSTHWKLCATCSAEIESKAHTTGAVRSDGTHHWRECTACGEAVGKTTHTWGSTYSGDALNHWKTCTLSGCGQRSSTPHTKSAWHKDGTHHWKVCTTSGCPSASAQLDYSFHNWSNSACATCGYDAVSTCAHEYIERFDMTHHWMICTKCSDEKQRARHGAVWRNLGATHEYACQGCSWIDISGAHNYFDLVYNALDHWYECIDCGAAGNAVPHTYDDGGWCTGRCGYRDPSWEGRHDIPIAYPNGQHWTGRGELTFVVPRDPGDLLDVMVDLMSIPNRYSIHAAEAGGAERGGSGALVVTLDPDFLQTLSPGEHEIKMVFLDGWANGTFIIPAASSGGTQSGGGSSSGGGGGGGCAAGAAGAVIAALGAMILRRR